MAMKVLEDCINCAACETECPNEAIRAGDPVYVIEADRCTECVGAYDSPRCVEVCPADCIGQDPERVEPRELLLNRYQQLHADA